MPTATLRAGISQHYAALFHAMRFAVGDPASFMVVMDSDRAKKSVLIIRDVELDRARVSVKAD